MSDNKCGFAGKILRVNLTDQTTEIIPSSKYLPEYIGGRALGSKIFWDEVGPGVGAFDPENKLVFANGPTTGTMIPSGGRSVMVGISPNSVPEQYSYSSMGGWCGTVMKYAGYDAMIIEGKAARPTYIFVDDDQISFCDATPIWGQLISDTQQSILLAHGPETFSMAIGPAGENLCRNACITTSRDHTFSKAGFGAVFGAKNLKAVAFRGTGKVWPADADKVFELRKKMSNARQIPNPPIDKEVFDSTTYCIDSPPWKNGKLACSPGCTARCQRLMMNIRSDITGEMISMVEKCVSTSALHMNQDISYVQNLYIQSEKNNPNVTMYRCWPPTFDKSDPDADITGQFYAGDNLNYYTADFNRGLMMLQLCGEYGIDKYDVPVWYMTWIGMCQQEGLLDDLDFGMEPDVENPEFVRHFLESIVYRRGIGDIFAEGMSRAIRKLGKEKYGDSIYHGRTNLDGEQLDIPVSLESGWGHCSHWQGRGFMGTPKWMWLANSLNILVSTRDSMSSGHFHGTPEEYKKFIEEGLTHSTTMVNRVIWNENKSILKDSVMCCEWQAPDLFWDSLESEMYQAATGLDISMEELHARADKGRLLQRAILMRNYGRCRDMEVESLYPFLTYPDPWGETATWDEWNDMVDTYYTTAGWDLATGWPFRSTWEKAGMKDVADELEAAGLLPPEGGTPGYKRKENPFPR